MAVWVNRRSLIISEQQYPIAANRLSYREKTGSGVPLVCFPLAAALDKNKPESKS